MAGHNNFLLFFLINCCFMVLSSSAFQFNVGGPQGWVVNPSENYNTWASRMRFQVNDTLFFKYVKGTGSVLVVNKDDYDNCNTDKPITKFDDGNSVFKFDRSGPFYFIAGNKDSCAKGQKIIIVVLAVRNRSPPSVPSPPSSSPTSPSPSVSGGSTSPAPTISPTPTPAAGSPTISPSPATQTPVPSPGGSAPSPAVTPASSSPSPSSVSLPPSPFPFSPSTTPGSPGLSPPGGGDGAPTSGDTPSDIRSPPGSSATSAFTTGSAVLFSTVSLVLCGLVIFI